MRWTGRVRRLAPALALALVLAGTAAAWAQSWPGRALEALRRPDVGAPAAAASRAGSTPHDFRHGAAQPPADDRDVCVFCHTPYGAPLAASPDWQRARPPDAGFQAFATQDDPLAVGMGFDVAGMSVVCLSCHDAVQASTVTARIDDHPFGVPHRGALALFGLPVARDHTPSSAEGSSRPAMFPVWSGDFRRPEYAQIDGRVVWWVSNGPPSGRRVRRDLPLYTRRAGTLYDDVPFIECGTCHDPHGSERLFLRLTDDGGLPCRACHDK